MCSITVNLTNNTGQGPVTFNTFSFLGETGGKFNPNGPPFMISTNIKADGTTVKALYAEGYMYTESVMGTPLDYYVNTSGTAIFNLPNGDTLTIVWDLSDVGSNSQPTLTPTGNSYIYSNISSPVINGNDYEFNVIIS
jgi:hypothetical protein